jgi:hypothetical protein
MPNERPIDLFPMGKDRTYQFLLPVVGFLSFVLVIIATTYLNVLNNQHSADKYITHYVWYTAIPGYKGEAPQGEVIQKVLHILEKENFHKVKILSPQQLEEATPYLSPHVSTMDAPIIIKSIHKDRVNQKDLRIKFQHIRKGILFSKGSVWQVAQTALHFTIILAGCALGLILMGILGLILMVMGRYALTSFKETIDILLLMGATPLRIAHNLYRYNARVTLQGSLYGALIALLLMLMIQFFVYRFEGFETLVKPNVLNLLACVGGVCASLSFVTILVFYGWVKIILRRQFLMGKKHDVAA